MNYSAQGSITVKRMRNGDSLFVTLELNGKPLYQGVDPESGSVSPNWEDSANQPEITPKVTSTRGNAVKLSNHEWSYNGVNLSFAGEGEWKTDSTGRFQQNTAGSLKIIKNLASKENIANDSLTYKCIATVAGVEYNLSKSIDINIQNIGASSYYGTIISTTEQLTSDVTTATIRTNLYLSAVPVAEYHVKWYKDNEVWAAKNGQKEVVVTRDDVNGTQLFIAEFYKTPGDNSPVYRAGLRIIDTVDNFVVICEITSANKEVDSGKPVTVTSKIVNTRTNTIVSPEGATWRSDVMDRKTWTTVKTAASNVIEVSTAETDRGGEEGDVEVVAEVTWN